MNRELLCKWLGLSAECWPPEPHVLLGLPPGPHDPQLVEQRVQERLARLRGYQLSHPEEATEGMNRLALAFVSLTDAAPRPAPGAPAVATVAEPPPVRSNDDTVVDGTTGSDWRLAPPPVRAAEEQREVPVGIIEPDEKTSLAVAAESPEARARAEAVTVRNLARECPDACAHLSSIPLLVRRVDKTRRMLDAWTKVGKYIVGGRKPAKPGEKRDFTRRMESLLEAAEGFPGFVCQPGRPGYRVVALAHLELTPEMFAAMDPRQRELLAADWALANKVLLAHRSYLCHEFRALRRASFAGCAVHALRRSLHDRPVLWKLVGAVLAVAACGSAVTALWLR